MTNTGRWLVFTTYKIIMMKREGKKRTVDIQSAELVSASVRRSVSVRSASTSVRRSASGRDDEGGGSRNDEEGGGRGEGGRWNDGSRGDSSRSASTSSRDDDGGMRTVGTKVDFRGCWHRHRIRSCSKKNSAHRFITRSKHRAL